MRVFKIPDTLSGKYTGSGHALVAVRNGEVIDMAYLRSLIVGFESDHVEDYIADPQLGPTIERLKALGEVSICMISCWEACEL